MNGRDVALQRPSASRASMIGLRALTPVAFADFGDLLSPPTRVGDRVLMHDRLPSVAGCELQMHLNRVTPGSGVLRLTQLERHPKTAQLFMPIDVSRYVVIVAPTLESGAPDLAGLQAFAVSGRIGLVYRRGIWHAGISVLDGEGSFVVAMWRGGDDDEFTTIPPVDIDLSSVPIVAAGHDDGIGSIGT